jgi:hypothetical protein
MDKTKISEEVIIDPEILIPDWQPVVKLSAGIARVIADAHLYLKRPESS